jgi:cell division septum initiation protein DivIVA
MSLSGSFSGVGGDVGQLLALLSSDSAFTEKLKQLTEAEAAARAVIDVVGPAESIPVLHEKAKSELALAVEAREKAASEAATVIEQAKAEASAIISEAQAAADRIKKDSASLLTSTELSAAGKLREADSVLDRANTKMRAIEDELARAASATAAAQQKEVAYLEAAKAADEVKAKFNSLVSETKKVWGIL